MNDYCSSCGLKYKIEPSFFYGAMYVSYGLTVAIGVAAFVIIIVFWGVVNLLASSLGFAGESAPTPDYMEAYGGAKTKTATP